MSSPRNTCPGKAEIDAPTEVPESDEKTIFGPPQQGVASQYQTSVGFVVAVQVAHEAKVVPVVITFPTVVPV